MTTLLIVEDERDLALLLEFNLREQGFDALTAGNGEEALRIARERRPDLILLDLNLPDISGLEVCRALKGDGGLRELPVVMLTARGEEMDRVAGFEVGADDYVVKPFSIRELTLRLRAVLRRNATAAMELPPLRVGLLRLEPTTHRSFVEDVEVHLTLLEFRLLHHLMTRPGRVQTREQLLEQVWGLSSALETRTIDTHVMRLREKLGAARHYVETVRGVGYRMIDPQATEHSA